MIISKYPIIKHSNYFEEDSVFYSRQIEATISVNDRLIDVMGLYVPSRDRSDKKILRKRSFISNIKKLINDSSNTSKVLMGDLNIVERNHVPHYSSFFEWEYDFYDAITDKGYIDAYRYCYNDKQEYSWVGRTNDGYRYDYGFVTEDLKDTISDCKYLHETRLNGLTDHSGVVMKLEL